MAKTLVALYDELETARDVIEDLVDEGFDREQISLTAYDPEGKYGKYLETGEIEEEEEGVDMQDAVGFGAVAGTIGGLIVSAVVLPGLGPILTAGAIGAAAAAAGIGAVTGGLIGALVDAGFPEEEAEVYAEGVRRGGNLVVIQTVDERVDEAREIMEDYDPVDMERRAEAWREEGWEGYDEEAEPYTQEEVGTERDRYAEEYEEEWEEEEVETIPIVEEHVDVSKRRREEDVRVRVYVVKEPVEREVTLRDERVKVEHRPAEGADFAGKEVLDERVIEMTEATEEVVVDKDAELVEEVVISKEVDEHTETVKDTERHTEVEVERLEEGEHEAEEEWEEEYDVADTGRSDPFANYEEGFRTHYSDYYLSRGYTYAETRPAYRFGYDLANEPDYADRDWKEVEPQARRRWEEEEDYEGPWEDFKEAVRHAWNEITD
ncbi:MAG: YsnF/AvaK domain-containing protein [Anaerolineales bacterium]